MNDFRTVGKKPGRGCGGRSGGHGVISHADPEAVIGAFNHRLAGQSDRRGGQRFSDQRAGGFRRDQRGGDGQAKDKVRLLRNAGLEANQPACAPLEFDLGAGRRPLRQPDLEGQDQLMLIAVVHESGERDGVGGGPGELADAHPLGQLPVNFGRKAAIADILPVDVPTAVIQIQAQRPQEQIPGNDRRAFGYQFRQGVARANRFGERPSGRAQNAGGHGADAQKALHRLDHASSS